MPGPLKRLTSSSSLEDVPAKSASAAETRSKTMSGVIAPPYRLVENGEISGSQSTPLTAASGFAVERDHAAMTVFDTRLLHSTRTLPELSIVSVSTLFPPLPHFRPSPLHPPSPPTTPQLIPHIITPLCPISPSSAFSNRHLSTFSVCFSHLFQSSSLPVFDSLLSASLRFCLIFFRVFTLLFIPPHSPTLFLSCNFAT